MTLKTVFLFANGTPVPNNYGVVVDNWHNSFLVTLVEGESIGSATHLTAEEMKDFLQRKYKVEACISPVWNGFQITINSLGHVTESELKDYIQTQFAVEYIECFHSVAVVQNKAA